MAGQLSPYDLSGMKRAAADNRMLGPGGAPTRATSLPIDPADRKKHPVASGVLDYFPDAIVAVSRVSWQGNEQHNPGLSLRWTRGKSSDEADTMMRHFLQRGTIDTDGIRHTAKAAWRLLALLQKEIEAEVEFDTNSFQPIPDSSFYRPQAIQVLRKNRFAGSVHAIDESEDYL